MNQDSKENLWLIDHLHKCRCCFERFDHNENQFEITEIIEEQFLELTQIELKPSPNFSNTICSKCKSELQSISNFRLNLITKQQQLYDFVIASPYEIQDDIKFESINTKIETQSSDEFDTNFQFESSSDEAEFPKVPVISTTIKTKLPKKSACQLKSHKSEVETKVQKKTKTKVQTKKQKKTQIKTQTSVQSQKVVSNQKSLKKPVNHERSKQEGFSCDLCKYRGNFKFRIRTHMKKHLTKTVLKKRINNNNNNNNKNNNKLCPHCGTVVEMLSRHIRRMHTKQYRFFCDLCEYSTFEKPRFRDHMLTHLPKQYRTKLYCGQCNFISISYDNMKSHEKYSHNTNGEKFVCPCGKVFPKRCLLSAHRKAIHEKKKIIYSCNICQTVFPTNVKLKKHMQSHVEKVEKIHDKACEFCGKMFVTLSQLNAHLIYHKDPQFMCSVEECKTKFFKKAALEKHEKTHLGQRDFACKLCDKKYYIADTLSRHVLFFHKRLKLHCEIPGCTSKFVKKETYRLHVLSYHKEITKDEKQALLKKIKELRQV